ncbi:hypothetical protein [Leptospira santarosai]|uniref:Putative lipoprotein n=1 Tax=Leptospira santarosai str. ZUN179 TaxID=1049985 RepID=M6V2M0_9LEPT|nr:hypothetical protein [Leptospira santarosai]EMO43783.1 putative lipoprotein [Leptospira santarosai str. ZUN179]
MKKKIIYLLTFACIFFSCANYEEAYLKQLKLLENGIIDYELKRTEAVNLPDTTLKKKIQNFYTTIRDSENTVESCRATEPINLKKASAEDRAYWSKTFAFRCIQEIRTIERDNDFKVKYVDKQVELLYNIQFEKKTVSLYLRFASYFDPNREYQEDPLEYKYDSEQADLAADQHFQKLVAYLKN